MTIDAPRPLPLGLSCPLVLVGLMGAGKTSVGRRLADTLGVSFRDSDSEIEAAAGMEISEIFSVHGEAYFRAGERRVIARLLEEETCVLATGGGVFAQQENRALIRDRAVSVWIDADLDTLWSRGKDRDTRPLLRAPDPRAVLAELLAQRRPAYAEADVRVESPAGITQDQMVRQILSAVHARDRAQPGTRPVLYKVARHG